MKNQFYYKRREEIKGKTKEEPSTFIDRTDSFNMEKVIRSYELPEALLIILDDFHEEKREQPVFNKKREFTGTRFEVGTYSSEITLTKEDAERYRKLTTVE